MDPDLTVICRSGQGESRKEKSFQGHSVFFALHSTYFDTLLSSEMEEAASKHVTLEDVDPETFDQAMILLEKLDHSSTKLEDLLKVASIYNRFQFEKGLECVQNRVGAFLKNIYGRTVENPSILDTVIDCALVADEASMQDQLFDVKEILLVELYKDLLHGRNLFTLAQLRRLHSFFVARPQWVASILNERSSRLHPPDTSSADFPDYLHSLLVESSNFNAIRDAGLKLRLNFRISTREGTQSTGLVEGKGHELRITRFSLFDSINIARDVNGRRKYSVRLCRFGNRAFEFRQCQHKDLDDSDWCMHVTVFDNDNSELDEFDDFDGSYTKMHFLAFLPNSKGHLIPPLSTHEWISLGLVDHRAHPYDPYQDESDVEPLEAADSFLLSVDRVEHVWGGRAGA